MATPSIAEMQETIKQGANDIAQRFLIARIREMPAQASKGFAKGTVPGSDKALVDQLRTAIIAELDNSLTKGRRPQIEIQIERGATVLVIATLVHI